MNLALGLAIAPPQGQARFDRLVIFLDSLGKRAQFSDPVCLNLRKLGIKLAPLVASEAIVMVACWRSATIEPTA